ncbi:MAG: PAS domain S-box protein [Deltaproteobacteria bacterium]|nr:PAS domain S-box protein [Deltaproteobacteria bacterium]
MSSSHLLWVGSSAARAEFAREILQVELDQLSVNIAPEAREALHILAKKPGEHLIVIIDAGNTDMELATLATGIKQINPLIEIIILGCPGLAWGNLTLPRYYRPIILDQPCSPDTLISCVAKLQEMVEAKQDYDQLCRGIGDNIGMSRISTEAVLTLLARQNCLGMISMRRDGFFTSYNAEAERLTGYSIEELAHIQVWAHAVLFDHETVQTLLDSIAMFWSRKTGRENMRLMIRRKDGPVLTLSMTAVVLLDNFGQARQIVMLFFDPLEIGAATEYELLINSSPCALYTYLPEKGFVKISAAAINVINQAFSLNLKALDILDKKVVNLQIPKETAESWQDFLESVASGSTEPKKGFPPIGLPGRHILEHKFIDRIRTGTREKFGVLAVIVPREDLFFDSVENQSDEMLAERTLNTIPRPFLLIRAIRNENSAIRDFKCLSVNPAGFRFIGSDPSFQSGMSFAHVFKDTEATKLLFESACEVTETGAEKDFELRITPNSDDNKQSVIHFWLGKVGDGAAIFFHDVTAIRHEESELKHYRHIFSHMDEAIIVTDLDGNVIDWNPASERMFGYSKEQILGKSAHLLTQSPDGVQMKQQSRDVLRDGDVWKGEYGFVRKDGSRGIAISVFALLKDDQGTVYGTVGLSHDLTERKRLEERLTAKSQELQEKNMALNTLLRHAETERVTACERVVADMARKINDHLFRILEGKTKPQTVETQANLLLQELGTAPENRRLERTDHYLKLTEKELEVAQLIRLGKTSEEIAFILDKSPDTIRLQRISIRKKLGIDRKDRNLASYLKKIDLS